MFRGIFSLCSLPLLKSSWHALAKACGTMLQGYCLWRLLIPISLIWNYNWTRASSCMSYPQRQEFLRAFWQFKEISVILLFASKQFIIMAKIISSWSHQPVFENYYVWYNVALKRSKLMSVKRLTYEKSQLNIKYNHSYYCYYTLFFQY